MEWRELTLEVTNIDPPRGGSLSVMVFLEEGFPKDHGKAIQRYVLPVSAPIELMVIEVPSGFFAVKVHHDEDGSGHIKKNWTGFMPAEGIGFSSGARIRFGPPSFKDARLSYPESGKLTIPIRYP